MNKETKSCQSCELTRFEHDLIIELSEAGVHIPQISLVKAEELLHSLKPLVCDHFNVSALHYIHGGPVAIKHFQNLVNSAVSNLENTKCAEMNTAHACLLYKGHSKDKSQASITISTCPFISKAVVYYIR